MTTPNPSNSIFGLVAPFATLCGIEADSAGDGWARVRLVLGAQHCNSHGFAHGGMLCTLFDMALSSAARLTIGAPVVTLDMQTRFLAPGRGVLLAEGRVVKAGRTIVFCDGDIRDDAGELIATATGLFKPRPARDKGETG